MFASLVVPYLQIFAVSCNGSTFFGIPAWYTYLAKAGYFTVSGDACTASSKLVFISGGKLIDDAAQLFDSFFLVIDVCGRKNSLKTRLRKANTLKG